MLRTITIHVSSTHHFQLLFQNFIEHHLHTVHIRYFCYTVDCLHIKLSELRKLLFTYTSSSHEIKCSIA